jgi:flagellar biosynthesis protein FliQ
VKNSAADVRRHSYRPRHLHEGLLVAILTIVGQPVGHPTLSFRPKAGCLFNVFQFLGFMYIASISQFTYLSYTVYSIFFLSSSWLFLCL